MLVPRNCNPTLADLSLELVQSLSDADWTIAQDIIGAKQTVEWVEQDLEKMSWERLLPRAVILEKVARYEGHLSRQLYKAMHELEALQARHRGGAAPLARLDVDGIDG